jgi:hypothetical protein
MSLSPRRKFRIATAIITVLFLGDAFLLLYADMTHCSLPIIAALVFVLWLGLIVYSAFLIRCPRCSIRITALVDTRDGKPRGGTLPPLQCRFCGYDL